MSFTWSAQPALSQVTNSSPSKWLRSGRLIFPIAASAVFSRQLGQVCFEVIHGITHATQNMWSHLRGGERGWVKACV